MAQVTTNWVAALVTDLLVAKRPVRIRRLMSLALARHRTSFLRLLDGLRMFEREPADLRPLLDVQRGLARSISRVERRIKSLKTTVAGVRELVRHDRLPREEARAAKQREVQVREEIKDYQWLLFAFRTIGDALAFLIFDRWDLKPLAFREPSGALSGKEGSPLESSITRALIERGTPAIRSDLTNVIRYGDVAVAVHGFPFILEAKSGRVSGARCNRQLEAIRKISAYLVTDATEGLYGMSWRVDRVAGDIPQATYGAILNELIARSNVDGISAADVEHGVRYAVVRRLSGASFVSLMDGMSRPLTFIVNDEADAAGWTGYYPFTLSIRAPQDVFDFLQGTFVVVIIVDLASVEMILRANGYDGHLASGTGELSCEGIRNEQIGSHLLFSRHFFGRVAFEFLSLKTLLDEGVRMWEQKAVAATNETVRSPDRA